MALRFLQDHLGDVEKRIGAASHLDLAREGFDPLFIGQEAQIDFGKWLQRFPRLATVGCFATIRSAPLSTISAAFAARRSAAILPRPAFIPASTRRCALPPRLRPAA